jgi:hypothetical protein
MTYKFQRNIPSFLPLLLTIFITWLILTIGFLFGRTCERARIQKEKERQILVQKEIHRIA